MSATTLRNYKCKDVEMLLVAQIMVENAIANKTFLQSKRAIWTDPFFEGLKTEIQTTIDTYFQKDNAGEMRQATQIVRDIQMQALSDLAEFKVQIEEDFKDSPAQKTEILNSLGFTAYHKAAKNRDQEALINLLFKFKTNLTEEMSAEIVAKGTAQTTVDTILEYADTLKDANISQETFKGTRIVMTDEAINAFNLIYDKVISVGKIAANFYKADKVKQELFSFAKITRTLNNKAKTKKSPAAV